MKSATVVKNMGMGLMVCGMMLIHPFSLAAQEAPLFAKIRGKTLLLAVGTGNDLKHLPPEHDIVASETGKENRQSSYM